MARRLALLVVIFLVLMTIIPESVDAQATSGVNWSGQFFNNRTFSGAAVATATYANGLNFVWAGQPTDGAGTTLAAVPADNWSAKFTSTQTFATTQNYRFFGTADDIVSILLDGATIHTSNNGDFSFVWPVTAGTHSLQVNLEEASAEAKISLFWEPTSGSGGGGTGATATPAPVLTPTPIGPRGQVVQVQGLSLRTGPYLGASRIGVLVPGVEYIVTAMNTDEGGYYTWYEVHTGEQTGWASGRYLVVNGDVPYKQTIFENIDNAPGVGAIAVPRAYMNFRIRPSVRSGVHADIPQIPWGAETELIGRTIQGGQHHWLQVRFAGHVGWIYAPYISIYGNIGAVPIR